ncbi:hypothetical protein X975_09665, partial [Stegodyphus mimosarum]
MLNSFVIPALQQRQCMGEMIFIQDGVPPHIAVRVQQMLRQTFTTERVISRYFPTTWPPRSPNLSHATSGYGVTLSPRSIKEWSRTWLR